MQGGGGGGGGNCHRPGMTGVDQAVKREFGTGQTKGQDQNIRMCSGAQDLVHYSLISYKPRGEMPATPTLLSETGLSPHRNLNFQTVSEVSLWCE